MTIARLTWEPPGLPKQFEAMPVGGWPTQCNHAFRKDDFVEGSEGRCYTCEHCRSTVLFRRVRHGKRNP